MMGIIPKKTRRVQMLYGELKDNKGDKSIYNKEKWKFLLYAPFLISDRCCNVMKKKPAHHYQRVENKQPFIATMAEESRLRQSNWLRKGCNAFDGDYPRSAPMSFWTENDVLTYIRHNNLKIADAYGQVVVKNDGIDGQLNVFDIIKDYRGCQYETTGCERTGCIFCMFGITQDKKRFVNLNKQEPKLCDYCLRGGVFDEADGMWKPDSKGLGMWFVIEWLNAHGNLDIGMPNREHYLEEYQTEKTRLKIGS